MTAPTTADVLALLAEWREAREALGLPAAHLRLLERQAREGWIATTERLPDAGVWVLAAITEVSDLGITHHVTTGYHLDGKWWPLGEDERVTHWMPLPLAPLEVAHE